MQRQATAPVLVRPERLPSAAQRRLLGLGAAALDDADVLALASGVPRATWLALLDRPGGLPALSRLEAVEITQLAGVPRRRAAVVAALFELGRRVAASTAAPGWRIRTPADVAERLAPAMAHLEHEELRVLQLNTKNAVTGLSTVYVGNLAGSSVRVGEVFRDAVRRQAAAVVVVHNHPSGDPAPSAEDLRITAELAEAGRLLDIELIDHVVLASGGWVSLRARLGGVIGLAEPGQPATTMR